MCHTNFSPVQDNYHDSHIVFHDHIKYPTNHWGCLRDLRGASGGNYPDCHHDTTSPFSDIGTCHMSLRSTWIFSRIRQAFQNKWVWSGNTTITNWRQTWGIARKNHTTITRHPRKTNKSRKPDWIKEIILEWLQEAILNYVTSKASNSIGQVVLETFALRYNFFEQD